MRRDAARGRWAGLLVSLAVLAGCQAGPAPIATPVQPSTPVPAKRTTAASTSPQPKPTSATPATQATQATTAPPVATSGALAGMVPAPGAYGRPITGGVTLAPTASGHLSGKKIVVDPGHNGTFISAIQNKLVPAGNGQTKACNTTGTESADGTPEHKTTWAIGVRLVGLLRAQGATVLLTRPDDAGVGPCVDERAAIANRNNADLVLSIHGDGNYASSARGFHVIVSSTMAGGSALEAKSLAAAKVLVGELDHTDIPRSNYIGSGTGIAPRTDIAGVNLLQTSPGVMLEMGNLRNASDWAVLKTSAGQDAIARAFASAAVKILG